VDVAPTLSRLVGVEAQRGIVLALIGRDAVEPVFDSEARDRGEAGR